MPAPVEVRRRSFLFCRTSLTALAWLAFVCRSPSLIGSVFVLLALSAAATVPRAPMILLGDLLWPGGETVTVDLRGMRFAHGLGALMALACLALVWSGVPSAWWAVAGFAALKTAGTLGFCPAEKAYRCVADGGCCAFTARPRR